MEMRRIRGRKCFFGGRTIFFRVALWDYLEKNFRVG